MPVRRWSVAVEVCLIFLWIWGYRILAHNCNPVVLVASVRYRTMGHDLSHCHPRSNILFCHVLFQPFYSSFLLWDIVTPKCRTRLSGRPLPNIADQTEVSAYEGRVCQCNFKSIKPNKCAAMTNLPQCKYHELIFPITRPRMGTQDLYLYFFHLCTLPCATFTTLDLWP